MFLLKLSAFLSRWTPVVVIAMAIVAFIEPMSFKWVHGTTQVVILGVIMLAMGMTLSKRDFAVLAARPIDIALGAFAQFLIMPFGAWAIAHALHLSPALTAGLILVGSCPGGVSSNLMAYLCGGDVAYSVGMTTVSTLLSPILTPLLVLFLARESVDVDAVGLFKSMLIVTLMPVTVGTLANTFWGKTKTFQTILGILPGIAVLALGCIVGGVIAALGEKFLASGAVIFVAVLCHNFGGYLLGYLTGKTARLNVPKRRTLSLEVGMQNAGLATVLATKHFPLLPDAAVIAAVSCVWHSISGAILAGVFPLFNKKRAESGEQRAE